MRELRFMFDLAAAIRSGVHKECTFDGTVLDAPHVFKGSHTHTRHESFHVSHDGIRVEVVQNLACSPAVPVQAGDTVRLHGELIPHGFDGPLIHWTHHDPQARHEDGWIEVGGVRYA